MKKRRLLPVAGLMLLLSLNACQTMESATQIATAIGQGAGVITDTQAESIRRSAGAVARSAEEFTPEQEYYIGRSVGAVVLGQYKPHDNDAVNRYVNLLGQTLAQASDTPEIFAGYRFLVLDSDQINAFATPGGQVFVTRGLLRCCKNEDALAAVLAHEIGHVTLRHGMQAIQKARVTEALTTIAAEGAKTLGSPEIASLTRTFEGAIGDITATLINKGYARSSEYEADRAAVTLLGRVGYDPNALVAMLAVMQGNLRPGAPDFARTHPSPADRIAEIRKTLPARAAVAAPAARQQRFVAALGRI
jgi:predicted Zn-dependent protease